MDYYYSNLGFFHNLTFMCILFINTLYDNHKDHYFKIAHSFEYIFDSFLIKVMYKIQFWQIRDRAESIWTPAFWGFVFFQTQEWKRSGANDGWRGLSDGLSSNLLPRCSIMLRSGHDIFYSNLGKPCLHGASLMHRSIVML